MSMPQDIYVPETGGGMFQKLAGDIRNTASAEVADAGAGMGALQQDGAATSMEMAGGAPPAPAPAPAPMAPEAPPEPMQDFAGGQEGGGSLEGFAERALWSDTSPQRWGGRGGYSYAFEPGNPTKGQPSTITLHGGHRGQIPLTIDETSRYWEPIMSEMFEMNATGQLEDYREPVTPEQQESEDAAAQEKAQKALESQEGADTSAPPGGPEATPPAPEQAFVKGASISGEGQGMSDDDMLAQWGAQQMAPEPVPAPEQMPAPPMAAPPTAAPPMAPEPPPVGASVPAPPASPMTLPDRSGPDPGPEAEGLESWAENAGLGDLWRDYRDSGPTGDLNDALIGSVPNTANMVKEGENRRAVGAAEEMSAEASEGAGGGADRGQYGMAIKRLQAGDYEEAIRLAGLMVETDPDLAPLADGIKRTAELKMQKGGA
jgi:hypothetical protein